jgi:RimJ/RimL family protein N-acetyltransferase
MIVAALPAIETARLVIARLTPDDAAAVRALTDDPAIIGAVHFLSSPFTRADAERLIGGDCHGVDRFFGVRLRAEANALVGIIGGGLRGADEVEIGYWFGPRHWRRGYGAEAVGGFVALLRRTFPARRIVAECRRDNEASWRLLARLGFSPTGQAGERPQREKLALRSD